VTPRPTPLYAARIVSDSLRWGRWSLRERDDGQPLLEHDDPTSRPILMARLATAEALAHVLELIRREPWACALDLGTFVLAVADCIGFDQFQRAR
jgi:hypothetical protein